jgi:fructokinase
MQQNSLPILSIGEILIDLIASDGATRLEDVTSLDVRPGGAPANAAVALARLGVSAAFCGVTGDDPFGQKLRDTLRHESVDTARVRTVPGENTTLAFAWKDERGDGHFRILRMADALLGPEDADGAGIDSVAAVMVGSVSLSTEPSRSAIYRAVELASREGRPICFDVNVRPTLWDDPAAILEVCEPVLRACDLLKVSLDDARALFGPLERSENVFEATEGYSARWVVVTDGARGTWFASRGDAGFGSPTYVPVFRVDAIDPTGAGDAFMAATISRLIAREWSGLEAADISYASAAGAIATTRRGAMSSLPTDADVEAFLSARRG